MGTFFVQPSMKKSRASNLPALTHRKSSSAVPVEWDETGECSIHGEMIRFRGELAREVEHHCRQVNTTPNDLLRAAVLSYRSAQERSEEERQKLEAEFFRREVKGGAR
jgi:hypothetical protein